MHLAIPNAGDFFRLPSQDLLLPEATASSNGSADKRRVNGLPPVGPLTRAPDRFFQVLPNIDDFRLRKDVLIDGHP